MLREIDYHKISEIVKAKAGIRLNEDKQELVKARLGKRLRALGLSSYREYLNYLHQDLEGNETQMMVEALTTHVSHFFREADHFDYLAETILAPWKKSRTGKPMQFWSAGCAAGEEAYSLAITVQETLGEIAPGVVRILATDISRQTLVRAKQAVYPKESIQQMPLPYVHRYFTALAQQQQLVQLNASIREKVDFGQLNLLAPWPMHGPFRVIFCRNVMIYFDATIRQELVKRFWGMLADQGILIIGHTESLGGIEHPFKYQAPAIYKKITRGDGA